MPGSENGCERYTGATRLTRLTGSGTQSLSVGVIITHFFSRPRFCSPRPTSSLTFVFPSFSRNHLQHTRTHTAHACVCTLISSPRSHHSLIHSFKGAMFISHPARRYRGRDTRIITVWSFSFKCVIY